MIKTREEEVNETHHVGPTKNWAEAVAVESAKSKNRAAATSIPRCPIVGKSEEGSAERFGWSCSAT